MLGAPGAASSEPYFVYAIQTEKGGDGCRSVQILRHAAKTVAERIVDKQLLSLLKQWLKVRIIKVDKDKKTDMGGGKKA
jgi:hypothetical protein